MHKKIFIVVMILICILTAGCILTPKTVAGFVNIYNHEIENALEWQVDEDFVQSYVASCSIENLQSDNYGLYNSRKCVFHEGMVQFSGVEPFDGGVIVEFRFHESISSSEIFAMINAAILAAGDDYKKVGNIMLTEKNTVKLIDFGIARIFKPENTSDTEFMGTRGYAPPEQFGLFDFGQTDSRSDIYSLGITIKTLLGGDYDGYLRKILDKCTVLEPTKRFQTAEELRKAILSGKKFLYAKKIFSVVIIFIAIVFFPKSIQEEPPPEEKTISTEKIEPAEEILPVAEEKPAENTFKPPIFPEMTIPEVILPAPQINSPKIPAQVEESGEVELKLFLNGEQTGKEHMIYLYDYKNWSRDKSGQFLFPDDWSARLRIENHSGKDLISPKIAVNIGKDEKNYDLPAIFNGQSFDLDIPLGKKLASPEKGSGHLQIILSAQNAPQIFLNKTFFLVK